MKVLATAGLSVGMLFAGNALAGSFYGAFAYDPANGNYGASQNFGAPRQASSVACDIAKSSRGPKPAGLSPCSPMFVVRWRSETAGAGFSVERNYEQDALNQCSPGGSNPNCKIRTTNCNHAYQPDRTVPSSGYSPYPFNNTTVVHREASGCYNSSFQHVTC